MVQVRNLEIMITIHVRQTPNKTMVYLIFIGRNFSGFLSKATHIDLELIQSKTQFDFTLYDKRASFEIDWKQELRDLDQLRLKSD